MHSRLRLWYVCYIFYFRRFTFGGEQEHAGGLSSRLQQREEELADAAVLMTETRQDLTALRERAKEGEQVTPYEFELSGFELYVVVVSTTQLFLQLI